MDYGNFNGSLFQIPTMADMMFDQGLDAFIEVAKEEGGFERFIPKLEAFKKTYLNKALESYSSKGHAFNVLNHGDFHTKNLLLKKNDEDKVEKFCFVRFHLFMLVPNK